MPVNLPDCKSGVYSNLNHCQNCANAANFLSFIREIDHNAIESPHLIYNDSGSMHTVSAYSTSPPQILLVLSNDHCYLKSITCPDGYALNYVSIDAIQPIIDAERNQRSSQK